MHLRLVMIDRQFTAGVSFGDAAILAGEVGPLPDL